MFLRSERLFFIKTFSKKKFKRNLSSGGKMKDAYKILNVNRNATLEEIKKSYKELARQLHPDKGGTSEQFIEIKEAYESLSNKNTQQVIDPTWPAQDVLPKRPWNTPSLPYNFIGRDQLLSDISTYFRNKQNHVQILTCYGLSGAGKTMLALQFIKKFASEFNGVCWFSGDNLESDYISLGYTLNLFSGRFELTPAESISLVKTWLENHPGWLLIYDNVSFDHRIQEFFPTYGGSILITSNHSNWPGSQCIAVTEFTEDEAKQYIKKITKFNCEDEIKRLIQTIGTFPLSLAQACGYINRNQGTIKKYLRLYQNIPYQMLSYDLLPIGDKHGPIITAWDNTFQQIEADSLAALRLIYFCAQLHPENIPSYLLNYLFKEDDQDSFDLEIKCDEATKVTRKYSMLTFDPEGNMSMPKLISEVIKLKFAQKNDFYHLRNSMSLLINVYEDHFHDSSNEGIAIKQKLLPHLETMLNHYNRFLKSLSLEEDTLQISKLLVCLNDAQVCKHQNLIHEENNKIEENIFSLK